MTIMEMISAPSARIVLSLAVMLFAGLGLTYLTKKVRLPDVTGYILAGVLIGPYCLNLVPQAVRVNMEFITDVALAFIAFDVGRYFRLRVWKNNGRRVVLITVFEALTAAAFVTLSMRHIFGLSWPFSLLLGAIGSATAPASTIMTIRQYKAKGDFVNTILQVVALDDAVALVAFSVCMAIAGAPRGGAVNVLQMLLPVGVNLLLLAVGAGLGLLLHVVSDREMPQDRRLLILTAFLLALTGTCAAADVSPLLACMAMGTAYINCGGKKKTFVRANRFTPVILLLFFVSSGMRLDLSALQTAGVIGVAYFLIRIAGKYVGASLGAWITGAPKQTRRYLGMALVPQAGVSIGLSVLASRMLPQQSGALLSTIILSSSILYELIGPACAKASLFLSGTIVRENASAQPADAPVGEAMQKDAQADALDAPVQEEPAIDTQTDAQTAVPDVQAQNQKA